LFNSLSGKISSKKGETICLSTGAIEWELFVSNKSMEKFPETGKETRVFTYLHHKEDQLKLFGFYSESERSLFLDLIKVDGVGPKLALKILSGIEVNDFVEAVDNSDVSALSSIPGLGGKTAQKIILKLKGKIGFEEKPWDPVIADIINALSGMGFDKNKSKEAVKKAVKAIEPEKLSRGELEKELFKRAIGIVSGKNNGI